MAENSGHARPLTLVVLALVAGGVIFGGAAWSMKKTDQASFCGSCHVMHEAVRTHQQSLHAKLACNECHAPHDLAAKLPFKAASGARDIYENNFGKVADVIHATGDTKSVVNQNCKNCHTMTTLNVSMQAKESCTDCHRMVPHLRAKPIATRRAANE